MNINVELPALHEKQQEIVDGQERFTILRCGRQFGKSLLAAILAIRRALSDGNQFVLIVAPTYRQTEAIFGRVVRLLRPLLNYKVDDSTFFAQQFKSDHRIEFFNGSTIMAASAENPDRLRGYSIHFIIFDEAAMMDKGKELWQEVVRPALAVTRGEALFTTTPQGKDNWFYDLWKNAEANIADPETPTQWALFHFKSHDNPFFPEEEALGYKVLGDNLYLQEIEAEFVATANRVISLEDFHFYSKAISDGNVYYVFEAEGPVPTNQCFRVMTVDLAVSVKTTADYTAFALGDITRRGKCFVLDVYRKRIPGPKLADEIVKYARRNNVDAIYVENVAFQLAVIQELMNRGMTVEPLIAKGDKIARVTALGIRMDATQTVFPSDAPWLNSTQDEVTSFPDGVHDDRADALAYLALTSAQYAMTGGPSYIGGITLDMVHNYVKETGDDSDVAIMALKAQALKAKKESAATATSRGGMALERMRGPM